MNLHILLDTYVTLQTRTFCSQILEPNITSLCLRSFPSAAHNAIAVFDQVRPASIEQGAEIDIERVSRETIAFERGKWREDGFLLAFSAPWAEPGAADVILVPSWTEHPEPGGVNWTTWKPFIEIEVGRMVVQ